MKTKMIIENRTELDDLMCMSIVGSVINMGKISGNNDRYCYITGYTINDINYMVSADKTNYGNRFVIWKEEGK